MVEGLNAHVNPAFIRDVCEDDPTTGVQLGTCAARGTNRFVARQLEWTVVNLDGFWESCCDATFGFSESRDDRGTPSLIRGRLSQPRHVSLRASLCSCTASDDTLRYCCRFVAMHARTTIFGSFEAVPVPIRAVLGTSSA